MKTRKEQKQPNEEENKKRIEQEEHKLPQQNKKGNAGKRLPRKLNLLSLPVPVIWRGKNCMPAKCQRNGLQDIPINPHILAKHKK